MNKHHNIRKTLFLVTSIFVSTLVGMKKKQTFNPPHHYNLLIFNNKENQTAPIFIPRDIALHVTKFLDQENNGRFRSVCRSTRHLIDPRRPISFRGDSSQIIHKFNQFMTNNILPRNPIKLSPLELYPSYSSFNQIVNLAHKYQICSRIITLPQLPFSLSTPQIIPIKLVEINPLTQKPYFENLQTLSIDGITSFIPLNTLTALTPQLKKLQMQYGDWPTIAALLNSKNMDGQSLFPNLEILKLFTFLKGIFTLKPYRLDEDENCDGFMARSWLQPASDCPQKNSRASGCRVQRAYTP